MKNAISYVVIALTLIVATTAYAGTKFRLPLNSNPGYAAWFDHGNGSVMKRYDCQTGFSYIGHHGTDFSVGIGTSVLAGAYGSLYARTDGCSDSGADQTCGNSFGNNVRIQHPADGIVSIYAHLKNGSPVFLQSVTCGGYVGLSGNSGFSSGPHLHFEIWSNNTSNPPVRWDAFGGSCSGQSFWVNQNNGFPTTTCQ
ncbi:MAG: hypothetical protein RLZZ324_1106 [Candidatus Parcubacteria bacterium]|jgi:murein DD-endopeptidase MepM/ murein hydrolase activator NlpD